MGWSLPYIHRKKLWEINVVGVFQKCLKVQGYTYWCDFVLASGSFFCKGALCLLIYNIKGIFLCLKICWLFISKISILIFFSLLVSLRENCPNTEFFLVCIFPHLDRIQENTDHKKLRIWTFFTQCLCHFTEKKFFWNFCTLTLFLMRRMLGWNSFLNIFFFIKVTSLLNIFSPYMPDYLRGHRVYEKVTYSVLLSIIFLLSANVVLLPQVSLFEKRDFPVSQNCCLKQLIRLKLSKKKHFLSFLYNLLIIFCLLYALNSFPT